MARCQSKKERKLFEMEKTILGGEKHGKTQNIPKFKNEDEEARFWAAHDFADYYDTDRRVRSNFVNLKPSTQSVTVRLPKLTVQMLKMLANEQDVPYQSLLKIYLNEKIQEKLAQKQKIL